MSHRPEGNGEPRYWLDRPRNVTLLVWCLVAVCVLLFFADGFYHKHAVFHVERLFGFYGLFGFTVYVGLIQTAKWLRTFLMRPEDYYDRDP